MSDPFRLENARKLSAYPHSQPGRVLCAAHRTGRFLGGCAGTPRRQGPAGGGNLLGITRKGRLAALTNYRNPATLKDGAPSRGKLVSDFLRGRRTPKAYLHWLSPRAARYNGFGLLVGNPDELYYFSNRGAPVCLLPGIHGMSNHLLDTPWPKVERGKQALGGLLEREKAPSPEALLDLLADRSRPPDDRLPVTGVGLEWERVLSPLFIESPLYGTRSSTVLIIDRKGRTTFVERVFKSETGPWMTSRFDFRIIQK